MSGTRTLRTLILAFALLLIPQAARSEEAGFITKPSKYPVRETIDRFETAITAKGWMTFTELDHAAAAAKYGLELRPRTVIVFGNPKIGTGPMQKVPTLAIDLPLKALVWQDDHGNVWFTYNSGEYLGSHVYPRHGLALPPDGRSSADQFLEQVSDEATK